MLIYKNCVLGVYKPSNYFYNSLWKSGQCVEFYEQVVVQIAQGVDDENDFPNALNPTQIYEWKQGTYKLNKI